MDDLHFDTNIYDTIRKNIKKYRMANRMTAAKLAELVGVSHDFIRQIESEKAAYNFSVDTFYRISVVLNVQMDRLIDKPQTYLPFEIEHVPPDEIDDKKLVEICEKFNRDYGLSRKINLSLKEQMTIIVAENDITAVKFCDKTNYDSNRFYRMMRGDAPSMVTLITFCIAFNISIQSTIELLQSLGVVFNPRDKVHSAYCYLLAECRGKSLDECNEILRAFGISKKHYLGKQD